MTMTPVRAKARCAWAKGEDILIDYHDREWGVPVHEDRLLFEFLVLEGVQAGLSWMTVLKKRDNYRTAYQNFHPKEVARFDEKKAETLLQDKGLIRNGLKIRASINNAKAFLDVQKEFGSFDRYIWQFVEGKPIRNRWKSIHEIPAKTEASETMSRDLKKRGFTFVGPTICYAFMQAVGMVNDHTIDCFRYKELEQDLSPLQVK
jgi:DNA-3-methyladenine glycosylase I